MISKLERSGYILIPAGGVWSKPSYTGTAYNDGDEVEARIKAIIKGSYDRSVLSAQLRTYINDWPSLYHLSSSRANVLRPFERDLAGASVLEIGAGCGAITRYLGEVGANVVALEGSVRRAEIARIRCAELQNVTVVAEVFEELDISAKFDFVTLIGVLEYAGIYGKGDDPAINMLHHARSMLKPEGRVILAIENKLGLKYFAGAPEDHVGEPMYGIESRYGRGQVRTYGRKELANLLEVSGFKAMQFTAPFPDYKLPASIVTERGFSEPKFDAAAFAWQSVRRDPQLPQLMAFSPELVWPAVFENGMALDMANSFLIVASLDERTVFDDRTLAWHYSTERKKKYCKETHFFLDENGLIKLRYLSLAPEKEGFTEHELLKFNIPARAEYQHGKLLSLELMKTVTTDGWSIKQVGDFLAKYRDILEGLSVVDGFYPKLCGPEVLLPGVYFDLLPQNIVVKEGVEVKVIDAEWESTCPIESGYLFFRALWNLLGSLSRFGRPAYDGPISTQDFIHKAFFDLGWIINESRVEQLIQLEACYQVNVVGKKFNIEATVARYDSNITSGQNMSQALSKREAQLVVRDKQISRLNSRVDSLESSLSWKITAPLRWCYDTFRVVGHCAWLFRDYNKQHGIIAAIQRAFLALRYIRSRGDPRDSAHPTPRLAQKISSPLCSASCLKSMRASVERRNNLDGLCYGPMPNSKIECEPEYPDIDISVVTYNSAKWVERFTDSLLRLEYPRGNIQLVFVDNSSTDNTVALLDEAVELLRKAGVRANVVKAKNKGYGAGHNKGLSRGAAPYCLVTNIDIEFETASLSAAVRCAMTDTPEVAAWEFRQKPYEHPKYYDPVTMTTDWNSHACVLLRRSAIRKVGGYDERIFMYGEDVELSYRLRSAGYFLRYCPHAVVMHYTYDHPGEIKPAQYIGSAYANLYIRLKYGSRRDIVMGGVQAVKLFCAREPFPMAKRMLLGRLSKLLLVAPRLVLYRKRPAQPMSFNHWDYTIIREGAFVPQAAMLPRPGLVSIITRTYAGRGLYLKQAMGSVAQQTWPHIEHIIVEDGGDTAHVDVEEMQKRCCHDIKYIPLGKVGRSAAGNVGLANASGRWCMFLDDDDLLFSDHVELLAAPLHEATDAVAAYSLAWNVKTCPVNSGNQGYSETSYQVDPLHRQNYDHALLCMYNYLPIQSVLFDRALFEERGGFDEDLDALEDWLIWVKYGMGKRFLYIPKVTSMFRTPAEAERDFRRASTLDAAYSVAKSRVEAMLHAFIRDGFAWL